MPHMQGMMHEHPGVAWGSIHKTWTCGMHSDQRLPRTRPIFRTSFVSRGLRSLQGTGHRCSRNWRWSLKEWEIVAAGLWDRCFKEWEMLFKECEVAVFPNRWKTISGSSRSLNRDLFIFAVLKVWEVVVHRAWCPTTGSFCKC